jgi:hypothetical protein
LELRGGIGGGVVGVDEGALGGEESGALNVGAEDGVDDGDVRRVNLRRRGGGGSDG